MSAVGFCPGASVSMPSISSLLRYIPIVAASVRKVHPEITPEQLESSLTLEDFNAIFAAVLEVSGLKKAAAGEATPVLV